MKVLNMCDAADDRAARLPALRGQELRPAHGHRAQVHARQLDAGVRQVVPGAPGAQGEFRAVVQFSLKEFSLSLFRAV